MRSQRIGQGFESPYLHYTETLKIAYFQGFFFPQNSKITILDCFKPF